VAGATVTGPDSGPAVPASFDQVTKLARYQLREFLRSRRFVALAAIVLVIGGILTAVVGHYRGGFVSDPLTFYGTFWGSGVTFVIVLAAVFFGGDAIAGEFQNKTGYFLMGLPVRRGTVYASKFIAAFLASSAMIVLFLGVLLGNGAFYFGVNAFPWQLGLSLLLSVVYLGAVLGTTFLFSSLFKTSAYGFVLTALLFVFGFSLVEALVADLVKIEPWMIISYASSSIGDVFTPSVLWTHGQATTTTTLVGRRMVTATSYTAGVAEGIVIMLLYLVETVAAGLWLFGREEFT